MLFDHPTMKFQHPQNTMAILSVHGVQLFLCILLCMVSCDGFAQRKNPSDLTSVSKQDKQDKPELWFSYRDAYRDMLWFEKFGQAKHLIQQHLQLKPVDKNQSMEGLTFGVHGQTVHLNLILDATGRTVLPMSKQAYDENAQLTVNRPAGSFKYSARISIIARADGIYEIADLRAACDQGLVFMKSVNLAYKDKKCSGVKFSFKKNLPDAGLSYRHPKQELSRLPMTDGKIFEDDFSESFRVAMIRFADWPDKGQFISSNVPLAIALVLE